MSCIHSQETVIRCEIARLKPHPKQAKVNRPMPDGQLQALAENIKMNGQLCPIEITGDGTIICGHQRVAAVKRLGWTEIDAVVRHDLDDKAKVYERLLRDNLERQHLDPLSQARYYKELRENAKYYGGVRDELAKKFNMSGRNMDRLVRLLNTPLAVQHAVSDNKITLKDAGTIAAAHPDVQKQIASELGAGGDPKAILANYLPRKVKKKIHDDVAIRTFVRRLLGDVVDIEARLEDMRPISERHVQALYSAWQLIGTLLIEKRGCSCGHISAQLQEMAAWLQSLEEKDQAKCAATEPLSESLNMPRV